jgi:phosphoribosylcarboxyaminoimidazole (NCAIR) mutase
VEGPFFVRLEIPRGIYVNTSKTEKKANNGTAACDLLGCTEDELENAKYMYALVEGKS